MSAVVTQTAEKVKFLSLYSLFLFALSTLQATPVFADSDCFDNNCDQDGKYWVKIKRLPEELELPAWGGEAVVSGSTGVSSGKQFCTIAFLEGSPREMFDLQITIDGSSSSGQYLLNNGGYSIPVTFEISDTTGSAPQAKQIFTPGKSITLKGNNNYQQCRDNELTISASVARQDIIATARTGTYTGFFRVSSQSTMDATSLGPVWMEFEVEIEILPVIQILGLKDIALQPNGNSATGSHQFCVFAMGANKFALEASSSVGAEQPRQKFALQNGSTSYIDYNLTVSDSAGKRRFYSRRGEKGGFTPTSDQQCLSPNMTVNVNAPDISGATGTYSDTMTFTVTPD